MFALRYFTQLCFCFPQPQRPTDLRSLAADESCISAVKHPFTTMPTDKFNTGVSP